jgi:hypothetical protein
MEGASRVQKRAGREFMRNLIGRNLIWMLTNFMVPAAILMLLAFIGGVPLRTLAVVGILVAVMAVIVTVLRFLSGNRRAGGGSSGHYYSGHTYYSVGSFDRDEGREGGGDFGRGDFGGGDFGGGDFGGGDFGGGDSGGGGPGSD